MNRRGLGGQIYGHLRLFSALGVRYAGGAPGEKKAPAAPRASGAAAEAVAHEAAAGDAAGTETLEAIRADLGDCRRCALAATRNRIVFGAGNPHAALMLVGEAPGSAEDAQGIPFVGKAGQLLTRILQAIDLGREDVYICNILKCRPPGNRNPQPEEIAACSGFLRRQIAAVRPRIICALGAFGVQTLLGTTESIGRLRGRVIDYGGIELVATYHPAYLLRNPVEKRKVWDDMRLVRDRLRSP
ncbi:MAG: uracil-DNA glycosylase [Acidobacteria bacterium]|nr:uracil-DNA glycosylase [Acidobacteriota bacterium]